MKLNVAHFIVLTWTALVSAKKLPAPTIDDMSPEAKIRLQKFRDTDWSRNLQLAGKSAPHDRFLRANVCTSRLLDYSLSKVAEMGEDSFLTIINYELNFLAYYYKRFIDYNEDEEYFGPAGESTTQLNKIGEELEEFWIESSNTDSWKFTTSNIKLLGAHGIDMADTDKLVQTLMLVYPSYNSASYYEYAYSIQGFIETLPGGYTNPLLTLNAFSYPTDSGAADVIVYGEGVTDFYDAIGIPTGPSYILAHEFGHQLQFIVNTPKDSNLDFVIDPSENRRFELMSDSFAGYFLYHEKGAGFTNSMIGDAADAAHSFGDCDADSPDHHGTPDQRKCAMQWGASLATETILHPYDFAEHFDDHLSRILQLDLSVCK